MLTQAITLMPDEHADIIKRGIDNRMDFYKLGFLLSQIVALLYLTSCVLMRNSVLQARFMGRVKIRLQELNTLKSLSMDIKLSEKEKWALGIDRELDESSPAFLNAIKRHQFAVKGTPFTDEDLITQEEVLATAKPEAISSTASQLLLKPGEASSSSKADAARKETAPSEKPLSTRVIISASPPAGSPARSPLLAQSDKAHSPPKK